jgi:2-haloacid dehalogenase
MNEQQAQATRWATFDCYGTLVDWDRGIAQAIESVAPGSAALLLEHYHSIEPEVQAEAPFRRYREVLAESLRRAATRAGVRLAPGDENILAQSLPQWPIFPDVGPALSQLQADGWKLAILSNVDKDLIAGTLQHMPLSFDLIVTAEEVQAYKPALNHFRHFQRSTRATAENWVHVARSYFHDIIPASQLGIKRVWINRDGEPDPSSLATVILPDLQQLPATLRQIMADQ